MRIVEETTINTRVTSCFYAGMLDLSLGLATAWKYIEQQPSSKINEPQYEEPVSDLVRQLQYHFHLEVLKLLTDWHRVDLSLSIIHSLPHGFLIKGYRCSRFRPT